MKFDFGAEIKQIGERLFKLRRLRKALGAGDDATRARDAEVSRLNAETRDWRRERRRILQEVSQIENTGEETG